MTAIREGRWQGIPKKERNGRTSSVLVFPVNVSTKICMSRLASAHQILLRIGTQMGEAMLGTSVAASRSQERHIITGRIRAPDRNLHASPQPLEPEIVLIAKSLNRRLLSIVGG